MEQEKSTIRRYAEKYPILSGALSSVVGTIGYEILRKIMSFPQHVYIIFSRNNSIDFKMIIDSPANEIKDELMNAFCIRLHLAVFVAIIFFVGSYCIFSMVARKRLIKKLEEEKERCDKAKLSHNALDEKSTQTINDLEKKIRELAKWKNRREKLRGFAKKNPAVESIQFFEMSQLPDPAEVNDDSMVNISIKYCSGVAKESTNVNAILSTTYSFEGRIYKDLRDYFSDYDKYYQSLNVSCLPDKTREEEILQKAINLSRTMRKKLEELNTVDDIKPFHYAYYRMYVVLTTRINNKPIEFQNLLKNPDVENELKNGSRTGILGTIFTNRLYVFDKITSITKPHRTYFTVNVSLEEEKELIMLVILKKDALRIAPTVGINQTCEKICRSIEDTLSA